MLCNFIFTIGVDLDTFSALMCIFLEILGQNHKVFSGAVYALCIDLVNCNITEGHDVLPQELKSGLYVISLLIYLLRCTIVKKILVCSTLKF